MADEAIVRIVLSDGSSGTTKVPTPTTTNPAPAPPPQTQQSTPPPPSRDWINDLVQGIAGANRHVLIEGQSGSGKSVLTRHVAFQRMQHGEDVSVVDVHNPEMWGGAKNVFQGTNAAQDAAKYFRELLESRKQEAQQAKLLGIQPQFKNETVVLSDFARLVRDFPALGKELLTLATEGRKFGISILTDTTALTGAATNIKGVRDLLNNITQQVKLTAPTATGGARTATVGGETFDTPTLPEYKERIDYSLVKPNAPPKPDTSEEDRDRREAESKARLFATVARLDREAAREKETAAVAELEREQFKADAEARLILRVAQLDREAAAERKKVADKALADDMVREQTRAASEARLHATVARMDREEADRKRREQEADPHFQATKRREAERRAAQINAAYKEQYGGDDVSKLSKVLDVASQFRGVIGGFAGTVVGAVMDVTASVHKAQTDMGRARKNQALLNETTWATGGGGGGGGPGGGGGGLGGGSVAGSASAAAGGEAIEAGGVGVIGATVGAAVAVLAAEVVVLTQAASVMSSAVEKYAEYNPEIAQAKAMAEIGTMVGDMRRSEQYSKQLVEFTAAQFEMQQKWEDVKMKFIAAIEPIVSGGMIALGKVADLLSFILDIMNWIAEKFNLKDAEEIPDPADDLVNYYKGNPGMDRPTFEEGF